MDARKAEKVTALVTALAVTGLSLFDVGDWQSVGIYPGCGLPGRLLYPFFHANPVHAALNAWCLLSVVFMYDVSLLRLLFAYAVAVTVPVGAFGTDMPTVGLSGVVFVLFGSLSFEVRRKAYFQLWMLSYLAIGFIFPNTNAWLHLYCYVIGVVAGVLGKPVKSGR